MIVDTSNAFINCNLFEIHNETAETISDSEIMNYTLPNTESTTPFSPPISNTNLSSIQTNTYETNLDHIPQNKLKSSLKYIYSIKSSPITINKKRGRRKNEHKKVENCFQFEISCHDDKQEDNMMKKIKQFYHKFLIEFINNCIKKIGLFNKLKNLEGKYNSNLLVKINKELFSSCLTHVLSQPISNKYRRYPKEHNMQVIENIKGKNKELDEVLSLRYDYVYKEIFLDKNLKNKTFENFEDCIPNKYSFDALLNKQRIDLRQSLNEYAHKKYVQKILTIVPRKTKLEMALNNNQN
jgi:hypothetical protein